VIPLLYVAGLGYSGSTLLSFLANSHPEIASVGELTGPQPGAAPDYPCACGRPIVACPFWRDVRKRVEADGASFDLLSWDTRFDLGGNALLRHLLVRSLRSDRVDRARDRWVGRVPAYRARLAELFTRNRSLVNAILAVSKKRVLLDASKHSIRAHFLARAGYDVRVIHLVRDSPGFVASCRKHLGLSAESAVRLWKRGNHQALRLSSSFPYLLLRYEEICADPQAASSRVAIHASCSIVPDAPIEPAAHVVGNEMRLAFSGSVRLDERWREQLAAAEIDRILHSTRPLRRQLGYSQH
jgi:hypothetical protein